ncbi:glycosyltransferase family 2 protein, partial [Clostridium perfringens]|uniref:glycosyltransferase family 2 protein n=1 Tax=Clostridium perfringens TaxID=1502 RepID=UPI0039E9AB10
MDLLVSVVIPTYKRNSSVVLNAVNSVKKQTYKNIEIIVVDDNGDENCELSQQIRENLCSLINVVYISHDSNKGACAARNTGIENANGEVIAFLDDDDEWEKTKIEKQIKLFQNDEVGFVYCGLKVFDETSGKVRYQYAEIKDNPVNELLKHNYIGSTSCGIVRKRTAIEVGMFDINLKSGQDLDFWIRLAKFSKLDCVKECLVNYRIYKSGTITKNYINRLESNLYLKEKYKDI